MSLYTKLLDGLIALLLKLPPSKFQQGLLALLRREKLLRLRPRWSNNCSPASPFVTARFRRDFTQITFSMFAKFVARAKGRTLAPELGAIDDFMRFELSLDARHKLNALRAFRQAKKASESFSHFATQFAKLVPSRKLRASMVEVLFHIAYADGRYTKKEKAMIMEALDCFGLSNRDYRRAKRRCMLAREERFEREQSTYTETRDYHQERVFGKLQKENLCPYATIGCRPTDTSKAIKKRYRKLVFKYHPDRVQAEGLSEKILEKTNARFREVQEAYEEIAKLREGLF